MCSSIANTELAVWAISRRGHLRDRTRINRNRKHSKSNRMGFRTWVVCSGRLVGYSSTGKKTNSNSNRSSSSIRRTEYVRKVSGDTLISSSRIRRIIRVACSKRNRSSSRKNRKRCLSKMKWTYLMKCQAITRTKMMRTSSSHGINSSKVNNKKAKRSSRIIKRRMRTFIVIPSIYLVVMATLSRMATGLKPATCHRTNQISMLCSGAVMIYLTWSSIIMRSHPWAIVRLIWTLLRARAERIQCRWVMAAQGLRMWSRYSRISKIRRIIGTGLAWNTRWGSLIGKGEALWRTISECCFVHWTRCCGKATAGKE